MNYSYQQRPQYIARSLRLPTIRSTLQALRQFLKRVTMPLLEGNLSLTDKSEILAFAGILFDMDGTIVDSTDAIVKHW